MSSRLQTRILAASIAACILPFPANADDRSQAENALGTASGESRRSHELAGERAPFRCDTFTAAPDFIVGIEKCGANTLSNAAPADGGMELASLRDEHRTEIRRILDSRTIPTHALRFHRKSNGDAAITPLFDYYRHPGPPDAASASATAKEAFGSLRKQVAALVAERKATHVILFSAGWHMEQADAVAGAGWMLDTLSAQSARCGIRFRPVTIVLTWPAGPRETGPLAKLAQVADYPRRSDDADEIGIVWGSRIIESVVIPAAGKARAVAIGHSLGARLLSSAVAARALLPENERVSRGQKLDTLIGLQAAFPRDRFVHIDSDAPGNSATKGVYAGIFHSLAHALFTTSANDHIVRTIGAPRNLPFGVGRAAPVEHYMGSYMTSADIPSYPAFSDVFEPMWPHTTLLSKVPRTPGKVVVADCSEIIGSHNDVWGNAELARLILSAIR